MYVDFNVGHNFEESIFIALIKNNRPFNINNN